MGVHAVESFVGDSPEGLFALAKDVEQESIISDTVQAEVGKSLAVEGEVGYLGHRILIGHPYA
ncbi:hypothetical protein BACINT_00243 [Bacteroides intestinalis DSM 17393]|uniref:Uncharacterized protein n=1 Tax=Bacteroides intestinalis DSM 17393 TaxID=471870 RepID=B3C5R0_9BACE|nr:hypothetical protein BACINT_00243 [Bacteroides intestinalis DSM 17393]